MYSIGYYISLLWGGLRSKDNKTNIDIEVEFDQFLVTKKEILIRDISNIGKSFSQRISTHCGYSDHLSLLMNNGLNLYGLNDIELYRDNIDESINLIRKNMIVRPEKIEISCTNILRDVLKYWESVDCAYDYLLKSGKYTDYDNVVVYFDTQSDIFYKLIKPYEIAIEKKTNMFVIELSRWVIIKLNKTPS